MPAIPVKVASSDRRFAKFRTDGVQGTLTQSLSPFVVGMRKRTQRYAGSRAAARIACNKGRSKQAKTQVSARFQDGGVAHTSVIEAREGKDVLALGLHLRKLPIGSLPLLA